MLKKLIGRLFMMLNIHWVKRKNVITKCRYFDEPGVANCVRVIETVAACWLATYAGLPDQRSTSLSAQASFRSFSLWRGEVLTGSKSK
ncbi:hypothetical protein [Stutzerimonas stutzeri]|jgi:hypothetical protein|uniref:hypothetical protein n=2 Tax=Pseudomonadaceae TaxID=135621 RepID=UPI003C7C3309